jgi:hypothetical protein
MGARAPTHRDTPGRLVTWTGSKMLQIHKNLIKNLINLFRLSLPLWKVFRTRCSKVRVFQDDRIPTVEVKLILKKREESKYK